MKTVLIIVHDFPPLGGGWVLRTLKFVKYLPEFGWRPVVLTVKNDYYPPSTRDNLLMREIPNSVTIYRTRTSISPYRINVPVSSSVRIKSLTYESWVRSLLTRLIPQHMRVIQDYGFFWLPHAYAAALNIIPNESIELIFTTSPPHNVHLLGLALQKITRLPWVADFRDGWMRNEMFVAQSFIRKKFDRMCEHLIINNANQLVCATPPIVADFCQDYPRITTRSHTVYNGFDPDDFSSRLPSRSDSSKFKVAYVGSLSSNPPRSPELFLQAVKSIADKNPRFREFCQIEFVGLVFNVPLNEMIEHHGLQSMCHIIGCVPHKQAVEYMRLSDVLLLLINMEQTFGDNGILTGKFGEYLAAGKPMLALAPDGIAAEMIRQYDLGIVVSPRDIAGIEKALTLLFDQWQSKLLRETNSPTLMRLLNRKESTNKLSEIFSRAITATDTKHESDQS